MSGAVGVLFGSVLVGVIAVGEAQARSAAGGGIPSPDGASLLLVDPRWATVLAVATAVLVIALLAGAWELTASSDRLVWLLSAIPLALVAALGIVFASDALDPSRRTPLIESWVSTAQSPLTFAVLMVLVLVAVYRARQNHT